ncbi:MAG: response regulator [Pirellulales bacterium]
MRRSNCAAKSRCSIGTFGYRAAEKGLELQSRIDEGVPDGLRGDALRIRQVLMNLISNAVKFTEEGSVTLRVALESRGEDRVRIRFSVIDTGIGISPEDQQRIFAPFTQVDASSTRRHGGTGLGLAIASDLVRAMGDGLGVESRRGEGSEFYFSLNLSTAGPTNSDSAAEPAVSSGEAAAETLQPAALRVLVAEDTPTNQKLISHVLAKRGHAVDIVGTGEDAVAAVTAQAYDVILMDVQMPKMDGLEATGLIRKLPAGERIPIIALTAHAMSGDRQKCLDAGMDDYLPKPLDIRKLLEVVEEYGRQRSGSCEVR